MAAPYRVCPICGSHNDPGEKCSCNGIHLKDELSKKKGSFTMTKSELRAIVDQQISVISEASKEVVDAKELDLFTKTLMNVIAFRLTSFPDSEQLDLFDKNDLASYQAPAATSIEPEPIMTKGKK